ncbi:MAG: hypothetical protein M3Q07_07660, partial [Pseudobdellovibrionaceae bacterium]|nr:hypothetical protein [Pseudobdellovibrionaceae bacterium]
MYDKRAILTVMLCSFLSISPLQAEPLKPQQDPETQKFIGLGLEYAASAFDSYTFGISSAAYKAVLPKKAQSNDGSDLSAKALKQIKDIVEASISSAIIDQTNADRLTTINQYLLSIHQQLRLVENRLAAGESEQLINQTSMEDLRLASATLVNLAGFQIETTNYPFTTKTAGHLYQNTNFFFTPQFYLAASLRLKILALSEAFGGAGYRAAMQREAHEYLETLQNLYAQFYEWNDTRFEYGQFTHVGNDRYAYKMGGQLQDDHTSAYIWREMSLYKHRDYDFDNLKARLFTGGAEVIAAWAAIAGETNYKLTDKKDPAALYPQAVYMSSAGYSGNGQPVGPYTYTFAFSTRGNPGRPDRYCGVDESVARSQSATPITGIRYLGLATYNSVRVKCQPHVIEAMRNGTSLTSDAGLEPDTTSSVPAMYNSKPASLYIVQKDRLHCTNVDSTATNWELKGETSWAGTTSMAQLGSSLYIIQANRLHRVQQTNGAWTQISPSSWDGPTFMAALGNYLY